LSLIQVQDSVRTPRWLIQPDANKISKSRKISAIRDHIIRYIILIALAIIWVIPLYIVLVTPFKSTREIFTNPIGFPTSFGLSSFIKVIQEVDILRYMMNSFLITGLSCVLLALFASLAAYAIIRSNRKLIRGTYLFFSLGLMIPTQACMIALFNVLKDLGMYNTVLGMVCAYLGCYIPVSIFLFYGNLKAVPTEIIESACIDGCTEIQIYSKIVMPLCRGGVGTVIIYNCVNIWKDFTYPLIFTTGEKIKTLPIAIYGLKGQYISDYPTMFAGVLISILPLLVIFLALQNQFIEGVTAGAVKG
jgi:raffinose/stachyose/melibiose transport system permease protein